MPLGGWVLPAAADKWQSCVWRGAACGPGGVAMQLLYSLCPSVVPTGSACLVCLAAGA